MEIETITETEELVVRRLILAPGEKMYWHSDNCRRFSVVVRGERLAIEYQDAGAVEEFDVYAGMAGWDEPQARIHRAINVGGVPYEEVVTFYRDSSSVIPQPESSS